MKPALEAVKEYLDAKGIKYEATTTDTVWFSLIIPTPDTPETPNRIVSCSISVPEAVIRTLHFSVPVMAVELSEDLFQKVTSFFMKYQSTELKMGRILIHQDGSVFYQYSQFLDTGGNIERFSVAAIVTTAIIEIASIYKAKDETVKVIQKPNVPLFGLA